jgi:hypothetical protein
MAEIASTRHTTRGKPDHSTGGLSSLSSSIGKHVRSRKRHYSWTKNSPDTRTKIIEGRIQSKGGDENEASEHIPKNRKMETWKTRGDITGKCTTLIVCDESSEQQQQPLLSMIQIPEKYTPKVTTPDKPVEKQPPFPMTGETLDTTNEPNHRSSESQRTVSEEPKRTTNAESSDNGAGPTPA